MSDAARGVAAGALHIMKECVIHMPVVLALEKNSALKPHVNDIIQHLAEGGGCYEALDQFSTYL